MVPERRDRWWVEWQYVGNTRRAAMPCMRLDDGGGAFLVGSRCSACGTACLGERTTCAACGARDAMRHCRLGERGRLYSFTTVFRSFPGVDVPFVMAVVDLDEGVAVRGTLHDADPAELRFGMPVRLVFRDSGQRDSTGAQWIAYAFVPDREAMP